VIKTKSILDKKTDDDGTRICVMRFVKNFYKYDTWLVSLAPSIKLLNDYRYNNIDWNEYEKRYIKEMESNKELIKKLKSRNDNGETITLLCWEKYDKFCHRRLLKKLIEECDERKLEENR